MYAVSTPPKKNKQTNKQTNWNKPTMRALTLYKVEKALVAIFQDMATILTMAYILQ